MTAYHRGGAVMIHLKNISKRYQMGTVTVSALDDISLDIDRGEFVVVLGPSGSGKTTLLNIIGALDVPTEGTVHINGGDLNLTQKGNRFRFRRETVSFIFQSFNLFPSLTALENVQFVLDMTNTPDSRAKA
ncbi:MAG: ABC transporter ATP-binding protein, partial [Anaerolineae bacterium]|nr:ABC transporter ATP-binding protein [Anaerolineae bacterium]